MNIDAEREINKRAAKVSLSDMISLLGKEGVANKLMQKAKFLSKYSDDIVTAFSLIRDWCAGEYHNIPGRLIFSLAASLIYFVSPIDLVPDFIPIAGLLDDATILGFAFEIARSDLDNYRKWKSQPSVEVVDV